MRSRDSLEDVVIPEQLPFCLCPVQLIHFWPSGHEGAHAGADGFEMLRIAVSFRCGHVLAAFDKDECLGFFSMEDLVGQTAFFIGVDGGGHFPCNGEKIGLGTYLWRAMLRW